MKCKDCVYRSYDTWNNPQGYFCERKTINQVDEDDFLETRVIDDQECNEEMHYGIGEIQYGFEAKK